MQRFAPIFLFALAFVLAGLLGVAPIYAVDAEDVDAQADAAKAGGEKDPIPGGPNDGKALWWNDPKIVKGLSLTDEQREKMRALLKAYREAVPGDPRTNAFQESLVQGNWKKARIESEKLAKAAETSVRIRGALKIDVLSVLSKEQLAKLVDQYPRLIYKRWRRAMRGAPAG
ncbi:MAG: Spy/CpxP family protein refolding chaperone [Deltaproteobacteria bacterium]|nr:Spy/CpxP family protein refolding chaperone [Deltaproteobacteria bacterium]